MHFVSLCQFKPFQFGPGCLLMSVAQLTERYEACAVWVGLCCVVALIALDISVVVLICC